MEPHMRAKYSDEFDPEWWEIKHKREKDWRNLVWLSSDNADNIQKTEQTPTEKHTDKVMEGNALLKYQEFNRLLEKKLRSLNEEIRVIGGIILTRKDLRTRTETCFTPTFFHHKVHVEWPEIESRLPQCKSGD